MNSERPPTRGVTLDELRETDGSMAVVRPPAHPPVPKTPAHTWGELSIPAAVAVRRERIARPRPSRYAAVEEPPRGMTLAAHDVTNPLMAAITPADLARFDALEIPGGLTLTMPEQAELTSQAGIIGAPVVPDDDSWSDEWDEPDEIDEGWVDEDDPGDGDPSYNDPIKSKLQTWLATASRDLESELSQLYGEDRREPAATATAVRPSSPYGARPHALVTPARSDATAGGPIPQEHPAETARGWSWQQPVPAQEDPWSRGHVIEASPKSSAIFERGEGDAFASGARWTKAMRASSSSGERSERTDVAGEGIAKAAAGKSPCFGAKTLFDDDDDDSSTAELAEFAPTPSMATAVPMPPPLPLEARTSIDRIAEARRRIAALKTSTARDRARRAQESTGAARLSEPDATKTADARAAALHRPS